MSFKNIKKPFGLDMLDMGYYRANVIKIWPQIRAICENGETDAIKGSIGKQFKIFEEFLFTQVMNSVFRGIYFYQVNLMDFRWNFFST